MKTISPQAKHARLVANVIASLRIEHLSPSDATVRGLQDCLAGKTSSEQLLIDAQHRHVPLRRD